MNWTERYVGMPVGSHFDCADLAVLVNREEFNREIRIPGERTYRAIKPTPRQAVDLANARAAQIGRCLPECAKPTTEPAEGDGVLIIARGYCQHIGIYCNVDGEPCVLHAADFRVGPQVVRQRVREMPIRGLKIEGFYRWLI